MNTRTQQRRLAKLIKEVEEHPEREELISIMYQQLYDDKSMTT